jgi:hypothetical protein
MTLHNKIAIYYPRYEKTKPKAQIIQLRLFIIRRGIEHLALDLTIIH